MLHGKGGSSGRIGAWSVVACALAIGTLWLCGELALTLIWHRSLDEADLLARFFRVLPWHLSLFAVLGLAAAFVGKIWPLTTKRVSEIIVWCASFLFFAARVIEGVMRRAPAGESASWTALAAVVCVAASVTTLAYTTSAMQRALPPRYQGAWPLASLTGWSLFFMASMHRAGPTIGWWYGSPGLWVKHLSVWDGLVGATAAVVILAAGRRRWAEQRILALVACVGLLVAGLEAQGEDTRDIKSDQPDVLVILLDAFRYDHLGIFVENRSLTPTLDQFSSESITFLSAFSPSNFTQGAMPGIFASLPPEVSGFSLGREIETLPEILKAAGYSTVGISTNPFVSEAYGYDQGFDLFIDPNAVDDFLIVNIMQMIGRIFPAASYGAGLISSDLFYRSSKSTCQRAVTLMQECHRPCFLYLHLMDPHGPYLPPKRHLPADFRLADFMSYYDFTALQGDAVLSSQEYLPRLTNIRQRYRGEVRYADEQLGRLVDELKQSGSWDESLVWFLSDHGEALGEGDWAGHGGDNLSNTLIRVPLILKPPRSWGMTPRRESAAVSTYSLLPTTLALLGIRSPDVVFGADLSGMIREPGAEEEQPVVTVSAAKTHSVIRWPWKLIVGDRDDPATRRLMRLAGDSEEEWDVLAQRGEVVSGIEKDLNAWMEKIATAAAKGEEPAIDPATLERLRNLGYVE